MIRNQKERDIYFLKKVNALVRTSVDEGNHPFAAILVDGEGNILIEAYNSFPVDGGVGHAEANLAREASKRYSPDFLSECTLYTTIEGCAMCAATAYWAGIGSFVYGVSERSMAKFTGDNPENLALNIDCRTIFKAGHRLRQVDVRGPFEEVEDEILAFHETFWK